MSSRITALALASTLALGPLGATAATAATDELTTLVDEVGRTMLARYPEEATDLGLSRELGLDDTQLNDLSPAYLAETAALAQDALGRLAEVELETLTPDERVTLGVAEWYLDDIVTMAGFVDHGYAVNFITGPHVNFPEFMADIHAITDVDGAEAYIERLHAAATQLDQLAMALADSQAAGYLPTERGLGIAAWQIGNQIGPAVTHPLVTDLEARLA